MKKSKRHIVVVGGTRGSGREFVRLCADSHTVVSVLGRRRPPEAKRRNVFFVPVDLQSPKSIENAILDVLTKRGKVTHVVFFQRFRGDGDSWEGEFTVTLQATKIMIERFAEAFDDSEERSMVVIGSLANRFVASEQDVAYHVMKAGLSQMVRYYASLLGRRGIRVNEVVPSTVLKEESQDYYLKNRKLQKLYHETIPLGRMGTSRDIAQVVDFFCSKAALFITGQSLIVDGGLSNELQDSLSRNVSGIERKSKQLKRGISRKGK